MKRKENIQNKTNNKPMPAQAPNRPFAVVTFVLLLVARLFHANTARPETPQGTGDPWTIYAFSNWELAHNDNQFTIRTVSLNNPSILLQFSNSFEERIASLPQTFGISLEMVDKDMAKFDEGDYENCEIFVDGIGYHAHAARNGDSISIEDKSLARTILASSHGQFVISFPDLAISYTFPVAGFKAAFNRVKYLHLQLELEKRGKAIQTFSYAGSICILIAAAVGIGMFLRSRKRLADAKKQDAKQEKPEADKKGGPAGEKSKTAKAKTHGNAQTGARSARQGHKSSRATYDSSGRSRASASYNDNFYERANFGNPFGSSSAAAGMPPDARNALEFFNLPQTATLAEIRDKRTFLLKAYHPDRFQGDEAAMKMAEEQTKKVNYNFDILARYYNQMGKK